MLSKEEPKKFPHIFYGCHADQVKGGEQFVPQHTFGYLLSGKTEVYQNGKTYVFNAGDFRFIRKNQLSRFVKTPPAGGEYRSISIYMDRELLQSISEEHKLRMNQPYTGENTLHLEANDFFKYYMDSLKPYMQGDTDINDDLTRMKVREAVMILIKTNPILIDVLFDFSEPGKIDLEEYMNKHCLFNVSLERFAYLTGRSLSTFHRDFKKIFHTTPDRWLQKKRLEEAYYQIREKGMKTTEVYLEVGFENLSHFSTAFKKAFGVAPSLVSSM